MKSFAMFSRTGTTKCNEFIGSQSGVSDLTSVNEPNDQGNQLLLPDKEFRSTVDAALNSSNQKDLQWKQMLQLVVVAFVDRAFSSQYQ